MRKGQIKITDCELYLSQFNEEWLEKSYKMLNEYRHTKMNMMQFVWLVNKKLTEEGIKRFKE